MTRSPVLPSRLPLHLVVGEKTTFSRTLTEADVANMIGVSWDVNPYHTDDNFARQTPFKQRIVPGLLTASMFTHLGGLWAFLATSFKLEFVAPVMIGETVRAEIEIIEVDQQRRWARLAGTCKNNQGQVVVKADIEGYPGLFEDEAKS